jgi:nitroreductase
MRLPVWIVPFLEGGTPTRTSGSSIYPAVQNMLLAARALGLGATLTTLYLNFEKEAEAALGLPPNVHSYALLPIGYPIGRFGPVRRIALADVVYTRRPQKAKRSRRSGRLWGMALVHPGGRFARTLARL